MNNSAKKGNILIDDRPLSPAIPLSPYEGPNQGIYLGN